MSINPEFRRNLWLELTPQRLIGMPLVLGALFLLAFTIDGKSFGENVANTSLLLFGLLSIVWGTKLSGESVVAEIRDRTWDGQRMSVIGPWSMTLGKLFGSTMFPWYGSIICVMVYALAVPLKSGADIFKTALVMVGAGLAGQTVALLASLLSIRRDRRYSRSQSASFSMLGIMAAIFVLTLGFRKYGQVAWFGDSFRFLDFTLILVALFLFWVFMGVHQLMRFELKMKTTPWVWPGFVLFLMIFAAGFSFNTTDGISAVSLSSSLLSACLVGVALVYAAALAEPKDPIRLRRLIRAWNTKDWRFLLQGCPSWIMILPLLFAVAVILFVFPPVDAFHTSGNFRIAMVACLFFILRDLALLLFFNLSKKPKRADMLAMLWLVMLWLVIPFILSGLGFVHLAGYFQPRLETLSLTILVAAPCEMLLAVWLVARRWKANYGRFSA